jgi:hypothetical protein
MICVSNFIASNLASSLKSNCSKACPNFWQTSATFIFNSCPFAWLFDKIVTNRPGRVNNRSTAQAASVKLFPICRDQHQTSIPFDRFKNGSR